MKTRLRAVKGPTPKPVATTIELPPDLWRAVKVRAADEHSNLRAITIRALTAYLATPVAS